MNRSLRPAGLPLRTSRASVAFLPILRWPARPRRFRTLKTGCCPTATSSGDLACWMPGDVRTDTVCYAVLAAEWHAWKRPVAPTNLDRVDAGRSEA